MWSGLPFTSSDLSFTCCWGNGATACLDSELHTSLGSRPDAIYREAALTGELTAEEAATSSSAGGAPAWSLRLYTTSAIASTQAPPRAAAPTKNGSRRESEARAAPRMGAKD